MSKKKKSADVRQENHTEVEITTESVQQTTSQSPDFQEKIDELTADLQRLQAEFANYKRREEGARNELLEYAKSEVVKLLLPLLDNIDRALAHRPDELKDNAWAEGVEQVGRQSRETLKKMGVEKIESVGQPFNHDLHDAVAYEDGEGDAEIVVEELQSGYRMGDKILRHAMVKVGKASTEIKETGEQ